MVTVTSRLPALIDYLVGLFGSSVLLGTATPPVTVYDGPAVSELDAPLKLFIGLRDPDATGPGQAGDSQQDWGAIGRLGRNETVTVNCCAEAWSGDTTMSTVRDAAYGIVASVEAVMQADTTQFGGNTLFPKPGANNEQLTQYASTTGTVVRVAFDLIFYNRIGGF